MKYGPMNKSNAIYTGDSSMVCGIIEKNGGTGKYKYSKIFIYLIKKNFKVKEKER